MSGHSESPREVSNITRTLLGLMSFDELRSGGLTSVFVALISKLILGSKSSNTHDPHQSMRLKCLQECLRRLPQGPSELDPETCHSMDVLLCKYGGAGRERRLKAIESECKGILQRVIKSDLLPPLDTENTAAADRFQLFQTFFAFLPLESQASISNIWRGHTSSDGAPKVLSMLLKQNWDGQVHTWVKCCQPNDPSYITIASSHVNYLFVEELDLYLSFPFLHARANELLVQGVSTQAAGAGFLIFLTILNLRLLEVCRTRRLQEAWSYFFFNPGLPTPLFQALVQLFMQAGSEWCCLFWVESRCNEVLDGYLHSDQEDVGKLLWQVMLQFPEAYYDLMGLEKQPRGPCSTQCQRLKESGKEQSLSPQRRMSMNWGRHNGHVLSLLFHLYANRSWRARVLSMGFVPDIFFSL